MSSSIVIVLVLAAALVVGAAALIATRGRGRPQPPRLQDGVGTKPGPGVPGEEPGAKMPAGATGVLAPKDEHVPIPGPQVEIEARRANLRDRLAKSRRFFSDRLRDAFGTSLGEETWEDVEAVLIQADIGVETATRIVDGLRAAARENRANDGEAVKSLLVSELIGLFGSGDNRELLFGDEAPSVWLVVGVNGTGKTTTIGKLAGDLQRQGRSVALAPAATFRAAADEQLQIWADRTDAALVKHKPGGDPGAVAYDAFAHARARGYDVLIVDTAGRLHTKTPLMDELAKIRRVIEKEGHVDEVLLVIDATAGQNGLAQAREFAGASGVTGIVLTKLDGTAKGGIALAIEQTLGIPIKLIGVGEGLEDLEPFEPKAFVDALLT